MQSRWGKGAFILPRGLQESRKNTEAVGNFERTGRTGTGGRLLIVDFRLRLENEGFGGVTIDFFTISTQKQV